MPWNATGPNGAGLVQNGIRRSMPVAEEKKQRVRRAKALLEPIVAAAVLAGASLGTGDESGVDLLDPAASAKAAGLRYVTR